MPQIIVLHRRGADHHTAEGVIERAAVRIAGLADKRNTGIVLDGGLEGRDAAGNRELRDAGDAGGSARHDGG